MAKALSQMKGHHVRKATSRAIERTLVKARHEATKEVEKKDKVKSHLVKKKARVRKPHWRNLKGELHVYQVPIPLISIVTHKKAINYKRLVGLNSRKYKNKQMLGGTRIKARGANRFYHRGFVNKIRSSGKVHILQRHGKETYKVRVPKILTHRTMNEVTPRQIKLASNTTYIKTLRHEYAQRWNKVVQ